MKALEILKEISIKCETDENFMGYTYDAKKVDKLIQEAIKELEEAMKPKTCEGCRHSDTCDILHSLYLNMLKIQGYAMNKNEFGCNKHQPKDNA